MYKRTYYNTCSTCGSNLDPGERCACRSRQTSSDAQEMPRVIKYIPAVKPRRMSAHRAV